MGLSSLLYWPLKFILLIPQVYFIDLPGLFYRSFKLFVFSLFTYQLVQKLIEFVDNPKPTGYVPSGVLRMELM